MQKKILGLSALEVIISLIVIAGLAAIAIPAYRDYSYRLYFTDIVQTTVPYKENIEICYRKTESFAKCDAGNYKIPAAITAPKNKIAALSVVDGTITINPIAAKGILSTDTYILTPQVVNNEIKWVSSGKAVEKGYVD